MAKLKLDDVELKMLDLMIAVKKESKVKRFDFISDIFDGLDALGNVTEIAVAVTEAGGAVLVDAQTGSQTAVRDFARRTS